MHDKEFKKKVSIMMKRNRYNPYFAISEVDSKLEESIINMSTFKGLQRNSSTENRNTKNINNESNGPPISDMASWI